MLEYLCPGREDLVWLVGDTFPIGRDVAGASVAQLSAWTGEQEQLLSLPPGFGLDRVRWLALYCRDCRDKVALQVLIPESFL